MDRELRNLNSRDGRLGEEGRRVPPCFDEHFIDNRRIRLELNVHHVDTRNNHYRILCGKADERYVDRMPAHGKVMELELTGCSGDGSSTERWNQDIGAR